MSEKRFSRLLKRRYRWRHQSIKRLTRMPASPVIRFTLLKAFVRIDQNELAAMPNLRLCPGMPATVVIPTVQRTAFDYIVGPLVISFNHSFRQK